MQTSLLSSPAGGLGSRLERAVARLRQHPYSPLFLCSDVSFEMPRIFNDFSGDISGRYIELFSLLGQLGQPTPELPGIVRRTLLHQRPEGYFGAPGFSKTRIGQVETKIFWGNGRLLIGLLEYHRLTGDPEAFAAARRIGDFLLDCGLHDSSAAIGQSVDQDGGAAGFATTFCSCLEGVVRLYEELGDPAYIALARGMCDLLPEKFEGFHSHGRVLALRGMLDLARRTDDTGLQARVVRQWEAIARDHVTCLGGLREHFGHECKRDEGCSVADWVMLSLALHAVTGEARYADAAEHGLLNHLLTNQFANGGFGHQLFQLDRVESCPFPLLAGVGREGSSEAYWCCSFHGPRALLECVRHLAAAPSPEVIDINYYFSADLAGPGYRLRLEVDAFMQSAALTVLEAPAGPLTLRFRVPGWSRDFRVTPADGSGSRSAQPGKPILEVTHSWQPGDRLELNLGPALHAGLPTPPADLEFAPGRDSLFFGPFLLGFNNSDDLLHGQNMTGNIRMTVLLLPDEPPGNPSTRQFRMIAEYHSETQGRTIWVTRSFVPTMDRPPDMPLRTVFALETRTYASLTPTQQEELASWR